MLAVNSKNYFFLAISHRHHLHIDFVMSFMTSDDDTYAPEVLSVDRVSHRDITIRGIARRMMEEDVIVRIHGRKNRNALRRQLYRRGYKIWSSTVYDAHDCQPDDVVVLVKIRKGGEKENPLCIFPKQTRYGALKRSATEAYNAKKFTTADKCYADKVARAVRHYFPSTKGKVRKCMDTEKGVYHVTIA